MRLQNPPVTEVGIDFQFDPNPEKQPWSPDVAGAFVARFRDSLPQRETVEVEEIRIEKRSAEGIPQKVSGRTSLDHVRVHDEQETRWLYVGNDLMAYRLARKGGDYPGFSAVWAETREKLAAYVDHFQPTAVRRATLRYVDIVEIPRDPNSGIELEDYFRLSIGAPEDPFGPLGEFAVKYSFPRTEGRDAVQLVFASQPPMEESLARFVLQWYSVCEEVGTLDPEALGCRLGAAHEHLIKCFFASFTPRGLELFGTTEAETP